MSTQKTSKLKKWREKYAGLAVAIGCLYSVLVSWGENWFMTMLLLLGVFICGTIGFFDLKRSDKEGTKC
ncbi:hypothetical protein [Bacillus andreraoultii]|uniref:hypothetical protein n=1 Tax=Bacillus andreraoultii TaxID=1499685 RepID=UPI00053A86D7|nr:hypothetical protein [Bacillus andreraoultii]